MVHEAFAPLFSFPHDTSRCHRPSWNLGNLRHLAGLVEDLKDALFKAIDHPKYEES